MKYNRYDSHDLWGGDIPPVPLKDVDLENKCVSACNENKQCRAYSFDKWRHACYLKSEIAGLALTLDPTSVTGVRDDVPAPPAATTAMTIQHYRGRSFPGSGYKTIKAAQPETCEAACREESTCNAYTVQKNDGLCRLFDAVSEYTSNSDIDSGVKMQKPAPGTASVAVSAPPAPAQTSSESSQCKLASIWSNQISGLGNSIWTISLDGTAVERGLGFAQGHATISDRNLTITWHTVFSNGTYVIQLDQTCTSGRGKAMVLGGFNAGVIYTSIFTAIPSP